MNETVTAAEANRLLYSDLAESYDRTEACVIDPRHRQRLVDAIEEALSVVHGPTQVLDACGGSGNVSAILSRHGVVPTVVDVSSEMLTRWERKAASMGLSPETHVAPIEQFLQGDDRRWDLIVFSSALHHLEQPAAVLATAASRLSAGGAIVTIYDPTSATRALHVLRMVDWIGHLLLHQPREFVAVGRRWLRRRRDVQADAGAPHIGRLAERHALGGIDDLDLRRTLEAAGLAIIVHERSHEARLWVVRAALWMLRTPSSFRFLAQRHAVGA
jgi:ubiquinone/menaquinone biosynthesis C-methylase UbiE